MGFRENLSFLLEWENAKADYCEIQSETEGCGKCVLYNKSCICADKKTNISATVDSLIDKIEPVRPTRQEIILSKIPRIKTDEYGVVDLCARYFGFDVKCNDKCTECWSVPVTGEELTKFNAPSTL